MENQKKRQEAGRKPQQTATNMWKTMGNLQETARKHRKPSETRPETIENPYEGTDSPFEQLQKVNAKGRG